jgi:hypothetical protein
MEPIGPDVDREFRRHGAETATAEVSAAWPRAVGEGIAVHAWPARLGRDGTLHVATESATWAFELTHLAPRLLTRLREELPGRAPAALRFAVGPLPEPPARAKEGPLRSRADPTAEQAAEAASLVAGIADSDLRELVRRTAAASLARAASDR